MDCFARSPSMKEAKISPVKKSLSSLEDILSPSSNKLSSHSRKRSSDVATIEETNYSNGPAAIWSSPKLQKVENHDPRTLRCPNGDGADTSMPMLNLKHWTDVCKHFCNYFPIMVGQEYWNGSLPLPTLLPEGLPD